MPTRKSRGKRGRIALTGWLAPRSGGYQAVGPCRLHETAEECRAAVHTPPAGRGGASAPRIPYR